MPRAARILGETGWAHIILRGINRENLFYDADDFQRFVSTINRFKEELSFKIDAYCLMGNHIHLLMLEENGQHAQIIKKIAVSYSAYYNKKYDRVGHVFQDRYRSEPVNDEKYLLTLVRYIYQNPQKAGICRADEYPYTHIESEGLLSGYFDTEEKLKDYLNCPNEDRCLEYDSVRGLNDQDVQNMLAGLTGDSNPLALQNASREVQLSVLCTLKKSGATIRQISRITGINRNVVQRAGLENE